MRRVNVVYKLAILATVLWLIMAPVVFTVRQIVTWGNMQNASLDVCLSQARSGPPEKLANASDACFGNMSDAWKSFDQAAAYWIGLGGSALLAMLAWIFRVKAMYTSRGVLAGRRPRDLA